MSRLWFLVLMLLSMLMLGSVIASCSSGDDDDNDTAADDDAADDDAADDDAADDDAADDDVADDDDDDNDDGHVFGEITGYVEVDYSEDLLCDGNYCYVAAKDSGVVVVDVSNVDSPTIVGQYNPASGQAYNLVMSAEGFLYVANRDDLLKLDVSDPTDPQLVWSFTPTTIGALNAVAVGDASLIYIGGSNGSNGYVEAVGEAAKGDPESRGEVQVSSTETCYNLGYANDVAYCGGGEGTLISVDVSNPASMAVLNTYFNPGTAGFEPWGQDVKIDGNVLYYSDWGAGLIAVDITDPAAMAELSVLQTSDGFYGSFNAGGLTILGTPYSKVLAAANSWGGLVLVDAADPAALAQIGDALDLQVDIGSAPHGVWVMGKYAYVADNGEQMLIIVKIND
jgi:hypothetical protein